MSAAPGKTIRLVVSDIDGTIVTKDKTVLPATIAAVGRLNEAGIKLALVSSRPPPGIASVREALGLDGPLAAFNGGIVFKGDAIIAQHLLPPGDAAPCGAILPGAGRPDLTVHRRSMDHHRSCWRLRAA